MCAYKKYCDGALTVLPCVCVCVSVGSVGGSVLCDAGGTVEPADGFWHRWYGRLALPSERLGTLFNTHTCPTGTHTHTHTMPFHPNIIHETQRIRC